MDFDRVAEGYDASRALSIEGLAAWRRALAPYLPPPDGHPILDLGCGTGQFTEAFATWFGAPVIGVEPSVSMRMQAERLRSSPRNRFLAGSAEHIPVPNASCGAAWLSTVIHHLSDLRLCARELRRVLVPGSRVFIRNAFPGRQSRITLFRFFPEAGAVVDTFPSVAATVAAFAMEGFAMEHLISVSQHVADTLESFREQVHTRIDTTLTSLTDEEFERGLRALDAEIRARPGSGPVVSSLDLLILRGPP